MALPEKLPYGRMEKRYPVQVLVHLSSRDRQVLAEPAYTENMSANGTRIVSRRQWSRDERVQVECIRWDFRCVARVSYCEPLPDAKFAVGVKFVDPPTPPPVKSQDDSPWPPITR